MQLTTKEIQYQLAASGIDVKADIEGERQMYLQCF